MQFWRFISLVLILYSEVTFGILKWEEKQKIIETLDDPIANDNFYEELRKKYKNYLCKMATDNRLEIENYKYRLINYNIRKDPNGYIISVDEHTRKCIYSVIECTIDHFSGYDFKMNFIARRGNAGEGIAKFYRIVMSGVIGENFAFELEHVIQIRDLIKSTKDHSALANKWYTTNKGKSTSNDYICKKRIDSKYIPMRNKKDKIIGITRKEDSILVLDNVSWTSLPGILQCNFTSHILRRTEVFYYYLQDPTKEDWIQIYIFDKNRPNHYILDMSYAHSL